MSAWFTLLLVLLVAPLLPGVAFRTRASLTGRRGAPVLQLYWDLHKLLRKGSVYGEVTGWHFRAGPLVVLVTLCAAALLLPLDGRRAAVSFAGDLLAFTGLLGLGRFALVLASLDTGSSFEGMGASREVTFASFAEPSLILCFAALVLATGRLTLSGLLGAPLAQAWPLEPAPLVLVAIALFVLLLAENSRVPVDDPTTHLELTMIHEVMVLDHGGPDLGIVLYGSALKLALFAALVVNVLVPRAALSWPLATLVLLLGLVLMAMGVGVIESVMARLRLNRVPQLLVGAGGLAFFAIILLLS